MVFLYIYKHKIDTTACYFYIDFMLLLLFFNGGNLHKKWPLSHRFFTVAAQSEGLQRRVCRVTKQKKNNECVPVVTVIWNLE